MAIDLNTLKTAGPTISGLTRPFWDAAAEGRLTIQRCEDCGKAIFYPRSICPHCWSRHLLWKDSSGRGRLKSFSEVHRPGHPGWLPAAPYVVGLVELAEGPTMLSFILPGTRPLQVGAMLLLAPTAIGGRVLPAFRQIELATEEQPR
ncbi:Zn-ribbon domain-containing OB-fold protein [Mesorhizobium sp. M2E.F.Ca.ET.209.01.1.1]|uniref:Zn-ribbon domain-containing OB-fold protein n=1 Tax=Mesorhizobium sp. M2E.F.Ca.ET.209.01.1.1 TaxID=2500526 RepID=UPI000FD90DBF|nr:Zn-ribbon domain-containing OB-fold protein [Mesorhizobium sp. M2E.F.Ca.ET.209.01.1.1]TGS16822.1 Zn-ribbon domain-containing OB-fold protein [Mesorhizobium sp. M2E.F.Ca.ET.209.01.1.1]